MNKIINKYLIFNFLKIIFNTFLIFLALGIVLNLFEEIEFFKNLNQSLSIPFILSLSFVPALILELLPFIVFLASMFYFLNLRSSKDLLSIKLFGYSNLRIILTIASVAFVFGLFTLVSINPITSALVKYYEVEKAQYAKDIDHLISINKNGVWVKEIDEASYKFINAESLDDETLMGVSVYVFDLNNQLIKRIEAESAMIVNNPWRMKNVYIYSFKTEVQTEFFKTYEFETKKILEKINSLYSNLNTLSFISLITNYDQLNEKGYSKKLLNKKINEFISMPIFLFLMVVLASLFTLGSVNTRHSFYYIILSILTSVIIYYFKDFSVALGQTGKISSALSVWIPMIAIGLFCSIGVIQINEK